MNSLDIHSYYMDFSNQFKFLHMKMEIDKLEGWGLFYVSLEEFFNQCKPF